MIVAARNQEARRAMSWSLYVGCGMLVGKMAAWYLTQSAAILSDAAESISHIVAVGFAAWSLRLSFRPADNRFQYGYERVTFFSAGFEGGMIILAAVLIIREALDRWRLGATPANLEAGTAIILGASVANLILGLYLVRTGRRTGSMIIEANGKHVLTDSWTSFGVVGGLLLVLWTGWPCFDPLLAIVVAVNILWSGGSLVWHSARGLMDYADPKLGAHIQKVLDALCAELGIRYHELRYRDTGGRVLIEVHLLFPYHTELGRAHQLATDLEKRLESALEVPVSIVTHLEALEDHHIVHQGAGGQRA